MEFKSFLNWEEINEIGLPPLHLLGKSLTELDQTQQATVLAYMYKFMKKLVIEGDLNAIPYGQVMGLIADPRVQSAIVETFKVDEAIATGLQVTEKKKSLIASLSPL